MWDFHGRSYLQDNCTTTGDMPSQDYVHEAAPESCDWRSPSADECFDEQPTTIGLCSAGLSAIGSDPWGVTKR